MIGVFIVLEGIDGCGKGEQIKRLHNFLFEKDKRNIILTTREPTYGTYGLKIRKILKQEKDPYENANLMLDLYTKDRKEHLNDTLKPFLANVKGEIKKFVLCDRYYHSTYAFQQTQGIYFDKIHELQKDFPKPTITFILDLAPEIALSRISNSRDTSEKFEKLEFMKKLRKNFLELKEKLDEEIEIIDASKSKEEVFTQIVSILENKKII